MTKDEFIELATRISLGTATDDEVAIYNHHYQLFQQNQQWEDETMGSKSDVEAELASRIHQHIQLNTPDKVKRLNFKWVAAAASVLVFFIASYFLWNSKSKPTLLSKVNAEHIVPGSNKAVLTLANGTKIVLNDHLQNGVISREDGVTLKKIADGLLQYQPVDDLPTAKTEAYNTITTHNGGQYQVDLPDGTKVWLNSASSLRYPVAFTGKTRTVNLTGEAYFEVAHIDISGAAMPFKVLVDNREEVNVLGTHFNIMAYTNEDAMRTTLLQGSVQVVSGAESHIIKPGEQAIVNEASVKISDADTEEVVAWKNGQTLFHNEDIKSIMRQVARWYDVDVVYEGEAQNSKRSFTGGLSRKSDLKSLLKIFSLNQIHCKVEGRRIIVTP